MPETATATAVYAYQAQHPLEERCAESARLRERHPGMVPVVCEAAAAGRKGGRVCHTMVPATATAAQLCDAVRAAAELGATAPLSLTTNDGMPSSNALVGELYEHCKNADGFLYVKYSVEQKFGYDPYWYKVCMDYYHTFV
ncbi:putative autophagy-related protein 8C-like [Trypanosoma theileri]|uniref:Autophagy-related protein n=1 Tax=Trypanosoma theileri TaxID=67003 RepID=A0A1X0P5E7_9TRYP|nr:putative autophagy-related protein 8C-like [Trypanosoma theileri]ORC91650.1 putative autophagy-related protein 8C-like [Trypanosoma theileri]